MSVWTVAPVMEMPSGDHLDQEPRPELGLLGFTVITSYADGLPLVFCGVAAAAWANAEAAMAMPPAAQSSKALMQEFIERERRRSMGRTFLSQAGSPYCLSAAR